MSVSRKRGSKKAGRVVGAPSVSAEEEPVQEPKVTSLKATFAELAAQADYELLKSEQWSEKKQVEEKQRRILEDVLQYMNLYKNQIQKDFKCADIKDCYQAILTEAQRDENAKINPPRLGDKFDEVWQEVKGWNDVYLEIAGMGIFPRHNWTEDQFLLMEILSHDDEQYLYYLGEVATAFDGPNRKLWEDLYSRLVAISRTLIPMGIRALWLPRQAVVEMLKYKRDFRNKNWDDIQVGQVLAALVTADYLGDEYNQIVLAKKSVIPRDRQKIITAWEKKNNTEIDVYSFDDNGDLIDLKSRPAKEKKEKKAKSRKTTTTAPAPGIVPPESRQRRKKPGQKIPRTMEPTAEPVPVSGIESQMGALQVSQSQTQLPPSQLSFSQRAGDIDIERELEAAGVFAPPSPGELRPISEQQLASVLPPIVQPSVVPSVVEPLPSVVAPSPSVVGPLPPQISIPSVVAPTRVPRSLLSSLTEQRRRQFVSAPPTGPLHSAPKLSWDNIQYSNIEGNLERIGYSEPQAVLNVVKQDLEARRRASDEQKRVPSQFTRERDLYAYTMKQPSDEKYLSMIKQSIAANWNDFCGGYLGVNKVCSLTLQLALGLREGEEETWDIKERVRDQVDPRDIDRIRIGENSFLSILFTEGGAPGFELLGFAQWIISPEGNQVIIRPFCVREDVRNENFEGKSIFDKFAEYVLDTIQTTVRNRPLMVQAAVRPFSEVYWLENEFRHQDSDEEDECVYEVTRDAENNVYREFE